MDITLRDLPANVRERFGVLLYASLWGNRIDLSYAVSAQIGRAARLLQMSQAEIRNRCTITGAVEIARLPGAVQLTILAPLERLDAIGLGKMVRAQYGLA